MTSHNAIVIVVDRLSAGYLGPYGNTWIDTPEFNRLASQSAVFDFALIDSPDLSDVYRSYWRDRAPTSGGGPAGLAGSLAAAGITTQLVTDEPVVARHALSAGFGDRLLLAPARAVACDDIGQTHLAQLFAAAVEVLESLRPPFLLWVHARAMQGPWDAPYSFRQQFVEDEDPDPPPDVHPPSLRLPDNFDPDELWGWMRAYAAQIVVLDQLCGALLETLTQHPAAGSTLLAWTSSRGYPLGEHQRMGEADAALYNELLHVPWMLRHPLGNQAGVRHAGLVQPIDLPTTLRGWWNPPGELGPESSRDLLSDLDREGIETRPYALATAVGQRAVRTKHWFLRRPGGGPSELYVKPDDRFEANEISSRCPEAVAELEAILESSEES
jgi:arylsulfatase A-like enzyme